MDPIKERGFAVVLPRNNLNVLYKAAQEQRENQARQQEQIGKEFENIKLGMPTVRTELQQGLAQMFKDTYQGLYSLQRDAYQRGGISQEHRAAKNELMSNWDVQRGLVEAYNNDLNKISEVTSKSPDLFNQGLLVEKTKSMLNNVFIKDQDGRIVGFNGSTAPSEILKDPDIYSDSAIAKRFVDKLGEMQVENEIDSWGSTRKQKITNSVFQTKNDGSVMLDPNTGKPIPKASPESIFLFDSDPVNKAKLDRWAQQITKEGESWERNRAKAFEQFVVRPFAKFEEDKVIKDQSDSAISRSERLANVDSRYKTLRNAIYNGDVTSLAQANNVMNNVRVKFLNNTKDAKANTTEGPNGIIISKRELVDEPINPEVPMGGVKKVWKWNDYPIEFKTDADRESALFELNTIMDESGDKSGLKVGNDAIRKVHDAYKAKNKNSSKSLADQYNLN